MREKERRAKGNPRLAVPQNVSHSATRAQRAAETRLVTRSRGPAHGLRPLLALGRDMFEELGERLSMLLYRAARTEHGRLRSSRRPATRDSLSVGRFELDPNGAIADDDIDTNANSGSKELVWCQLIAHGFTTCADNSSFSAGGQMFAIGPQRGVSSAVSLAADGGTG